MLRYATFLREQEQLSEIGPKFPVDAANLTEHDAPFLGRKTEASASQLKPS
jgi:hypothetical protein